MSSASSRSAPLLTRLPNRANRARSEYVFSLTKYDTNCTYTVYDTNGPAVGQQIAFAYTPQGPLVDGAP